MLFSVSSLFTTTTVTAATAPDLLTAAHAPRFLLWLQHMLSAYDYSLMPLGYGC